MNNILQQSFVRNYSDRQYKYATMVNHRGTVVAFAMDAEQRIYYSVLDIAHEEETKGTLDAHYWLNDPQLLRFPDEIEQVGFAILDTVPMPAVKLATGEEVDRDQISSQEIDPFLSSTARLTADAPFQVLTDNRHIYVFRQAISRAHDDMLFKLKGGGASASFPGWTRFLTANGQIAFRLVNPQAAGDGLDNYVTKEGQVQPLVDATLLMDRFVLAGSELKRPKEVRYRRSRHRTRPATAKDTLGAKDMDGRPFYEPTKELDFVGGLADGCFSILLLPTAVADVERWQIFSYDQDKEHVKAFNIERDGDGLFNTQGTQLYTSPEAAYKSAVLERNPGKCPFTGLPLVPVDSSESTKMQQTTFAFAERTVAGGLAARLYYEQETLPHTGPEKRVKQNARVLLCALTAGADPYTGADTSHDYIAAVDFGVNRGGKLAEMRVPAQESAADKQQEATIQVEIGRLESGIAGLKSRLAQEEADTARIPELEKEIAALEATLAGFDKPRFATFFDSEARNGRSIQLKAGDEVPKLSMYQESPSAKVDFYWNDRIQVIDVDEGLIVEAFLHEDYRTKAGDFEAGSDPGAVAWKGHISSVRVRENGDVQQQRTTTDLALMDKQAALQLLGLRKRLLQGIKDSIAQEETKLAQKRQALAAIQDRVAKGKTATIPLPPLLVEDPDGEARDAARDELAGLDSDLADLEQRIPQLKADVAVLNTEIRNLENSSARILGLQQEIKQLEQTLAECTSPRGARFYDDHAQTGKSIYFSVGSEVPHLSAYELPVDYWVDTNWNDEISYIACDADVVVYCWKAAPYKGGSAGRFTGNTKLSGEWDNEISSLKVYENSERIQRRTNTQNRLPNARVELKEAEKASFILPGKRAELKRKGDLVQSLETEQREKAARRAVLRQQRFGTPPPLAMPHWRTDSQGLTITSALLGFAYSDAQPALFESALGRMTLYFKGVNNQLFAAYYDVRNTRARWSLPVGEGGAVSFHSMTSEPHNNQTTIAVSDGGDPSHCTVTIKNASTGLVETWHEVPRDSAAFAQVLNGVAGEKVFAGKLKEDHQGGSAAEIELEAALTAPVLAGSLLIVEDNSDAAQGISYLEASAKAESGKNEIAVESAALTAAAGSPVYAIRYDYGRHASTNRAGYALDKGSLHVTVSGGAAAEDIANGDAVREVEAVSPCWVADAPGTALAFDGKGHFVAGEDAERFHYDGAVTMEAWVDPAAVNGDARILHAKTTKNDHYSLGLRESTIYSALTMESSADFVELPLYSSVLNADFTLEAWVRLRPNAGMGDQPLVGNLSAAKNKGLHFIVRGQKPYFGFYGNDLKADESLTLEKWHYIACTFVAETRERILYLDGDEVARDVATAAFQGTEPLYIGRCTDFFKKGSALYLHGDIDEVRIWNVARSGTAIRANWRRRLGGREPGLIAYYYFENRSPVDRSGNGHDGVLTGSLVDREPAESPFDAYTCFAVVGDDAVAATRPVAAGNWQHFAAVYEQSYALRFNASHGGGGDAGNDTSLDVLEDLTIEAFMKLDRLERTHGILAKGVFGGDREGSVPYAFFVDPQGYLVFSFEDEDGKLYAYPSESTIAGNTFQRVAVVRQLVRETVQQKGSVSIPVMLPDSGAKPDSHGKLPMTRKNITFETVESVDVQETYHLRFYVGSQQIGHIVHTGKLPAGNHDSLSIGRCRYAGGESLQLQGMISELRVWNVARKPNQVNGRLTGNEGGLLAWWRLEENGGHVAYDSKGNNHARLAGTEWVKTPDPEGSRFAIYHNGATTETTTISRPDIGVDQFTIGARKSPGPRYIDHFEGDIEEVRIWRTVRSREEILDNLFTRLKGEKQDLIAYYSFDRLRANGNDKTETLKDAGLRSNHLLLPVSAELQPTEVLSNAPISNDAAQVRSALAGIKTDFHDRLTGRAGVTEYADTQRLPDGAIKGIHKRAYTYTRDGQWRLITGYKVGNLVTEWIGQAQFDPQVVGYIEGAPPVPSENLTEGYRRTFETFNGTSEVTLIESESLNYTVSAGKEEGFQAGYEAEAKVGAGAKTEIVAAPLGVGISFEAKVDVAAQLGLNVETSGSWSNDESFSSGQTVTRKQSAAIGGNWDQVDDREKWANPDLTRRFIPANMGFAFVESETADVYALRLEHTGTLVAFRMLPNPDIPRDTNIIPFPINNRYTKQGTLDGRLGYTKTGNAYDPDYPNSVGYGEYSYFKPREAYALKRHIEREEQKLKEFFKNFDSDPPVLRMVKGAFKGVTELVGGISGLASPDASQGSSSLSSGMGHIAQALKSGMSKNDLAEKYSRRNLVNTYVWTADGGFFEESTQISEVRSRSSSGSYTLQGSVSGGISVDIEAVASFSLGLNAMLGGHMTETRSKSEEAANSFEIEMTLLVPDNLQQYVYIDESDLNSGVKPVYALNDSPVNQPGKVDAYRFMTFYLEPGRANSEDLFGKVVDPIWLEQSSHPNAIALRQANQPDKTPACWRVFHRVTFVSRILPDFKTDEPTLETKMQGLDIASSYELVRRLDPHVRTKTAHWNTFQEAVQTAVQTYLPELSAEEDLAQITQFLAGYYGVMQ